MRSRDEIRIYPSRWKALLSALGCGVFVLVGIWIEPDIRTQPRSEYLMLILTFGFFGLGGLFLLYQALFPRLVLLVDKQGVTEYVTGVGFVSWEEIEEIRLYKMGDRTVLGIYPYQIEPILNRLPEWKQVAAEINLGYDTALINVADVVSPIPLERLLEQILAIRDRAMQEREYGSRLG